MGVFPLPVKCSCYNEPLGAMMVAESPFCHYKRSEAISVKASWLLKRDCFVASLLAMTLRQPCWLRASLSLCHNVQKGVPDLKVCANLRMRWLHG